MSDGEKYKIKSCHIFDMHCTLAFIIHLWYMYADIVSSKFNTLLFNHVISIHIDGPHDCQGFKLLKSAYGAEEPS